MWWLIYCTVHQSGTRSFSNQGEFSSELKVELFVIDSSFFLFHFFIFIFYFFYFYSQPRPRFLHQFYSITVRSAAPPTALILYILYVLPFFVLSSSLLVLCLLLLFMFFIIILSFLCEFSLSVFCSFFMSYFCSCFRCFFILPPFRCPFSSFFRNLCLFAHTCM